jgi:hypothetical protein
MIPLDIFLKFKIHFLIKSFKNGVCPGALLPWISLRRRISHRAIYFSVVVGDRRGRGEVAEFYCSLEEGVQGRTAPAESLPYSQNAP